MAQCDKLRFNVPVALPQTPHITELLIRKSRFLAQSCRCRDQEAARDFIAQIRAAHPDATHNCWAFAAGAPGDTACVGSSDDGEPRGTAGRPMLTALLHCGIGQICVVVSRWFGGIKLGTGGLVRAYQDSVQTNTSQMPVCLSVPFRNLEIRLPYAGMDCVKRLLPDYEAEIARIDYHENINLEIRAPQDRLECLEKALMDATSGGADIIRIPAGSESQFQDMA